MSRRKKIRTVTRSGTQLEQLKTEKLDDPDTDPRNIASLARQYRETINQIASIEGEENEGDVIDEIFKRREAKR